MLGTFFTDRLEGFQRLLVDIQRLLEQGEVIAVADPASTCWQHARELEEMVLVLRNRLLRLRAEVERWPDARNGLQADGGDPDALAAVVASRIRDARAALAHVDADLQYAWATASRLYVE